MSGESLIPEEAFMVSSFVVLFSYPACIFILALKALIGPSESGLVPLPSSYAFLAFP